MKVLHYFFTDCHQTTIIRHTDNHQTKHHTTHTNHALPRCIAVSCACVRHRYGCQHLNTSSGSSQASDPSSTAINTSTPEQAARRIQSTRQALRTYEAPNSNPCTLWVFASNMDCSSHQPRTASVSWPLCPAFHPQCEHGPVCVCVCVEGEGGIASCKTEGVHPLRQMRVNRQVDTSFKTKKGGSIWKWMPPLRQMRVGGAWRASDFFEDSSATFTFSASSSCLSSHRSRRRSSWRSFKLFSL